MGRDASGARPVRIGYVRIAAILIVCGLVSALSYNGAAVLFWLAGLGFVLLAVGPYWPQVLLLAMIGGCLLATWATLGGGAEEWTAIPWVVAATIGTAALVWSIVRRLRIGARSGVRQGSR